MCAGCSYLGGFTAFFFGVLGIVSIGLAFRLLLVFFLLFVFLAFVLDVGSFEVVRLFL